MNGRLLFAPCGTLSSACSRATTSSPSAVGLTTTSLAASLVRRRQRHRKCRREVKVTKLHDAKRHGATSNEV